MELMELLDVLEKKVLGGRQLFFLQKNEAIVNKTEILDLLEAIHRNIDEKYEALKYKIGKDPVLEERKTLKALAPDTEASGSEEADDDRNIIQSAKREALDIKREIDEYAVNVLENLQLTVTKFRRKLGKLDEIIEMSKERLERSAHYAPAREEETENDAKN